MLFTIEKRFSNYKAAHRQWRDVGGHCQGLHGENWTFVVTLGSETLNEKNWVIGFGELRFIRDWFDKHFDHVAMIDEDDPLLLLFQDLERAGGTRLTIVPSACCEGLAAYISMHVGPLIFATTEGRVKLISVKVIEDEKNSATLIL